MLGKTAGGIFWLFRYMERSEHIARLVEAGHRIALTRPTTASADEWRSVVATSGTVHAYDERHGDYESAHVIDFLLRDKAHAGSVLCMIEAARMNARLTRTALTREVWEAVNECWMTLRDALKRPVRERELPLVLGEIRRQSALVRGALHGTMLRNDIFNFARLGTFLERAASTARILDVKYYVLLPTLGHVGSSLDNIQWDTILRSVSAQRSYRWLYPMETNPIGIAEFLILDGRFPRSLAFCHSKIRDNLGFLERQYGTRLSCQDAAETIRSRLLDQKIDSIFETGLHEFIGTFLVLNHKLGTQVEADYRFYG